MSEKTRAPRGSLTPEEARLRKNERQREYAKRTGYKSNDRYNRERGVSVAFRLFHPQDDDILAKLDTVESKAGYIKNLIRKDIEAEK